VGHVVLLGDSIFDNGRYVPGGPSVVEQVREHLPDGWKATLLAVDGSVLDDVHRQLDDLPGDATHLILSAGGNDALAHADMIRHERAGSYFEVLSRLGVIREEFQVAYRRVLDALQATKRISHEFKTDTCGNRVAGASLARPRRLGLTDDPLNKPLAVCTVYDAIPILERAERAGLALFNEIILREAARAALPVIDLRLTCSDADDYAASSPIEPSVAGGLKIARAIVRVVEAHDFARSGCAVYT